MKHLLLVLCLFIGHMAHPQNTVLWGNTFLGGTDNAGFIFKMNPDGSGYEIVHELDGAAGGKHFGAGMILAADGLLYGLTSLGGNADKGILYSIDPMNAEFSIRHHFEEISSFSSRLTEASNGKIYGLGAGGVGHIFEFDPVNDQLVVVHEFSRPAGAIPLPEDYLLEVAPNLLYSATPSGGDHNDGVLFEFNLETMVYSVKHHFEESNGYDPKPGLLLASDGHIYGIASRGGENRRGAIFKYDLQSEQYELVVSLTNDHALANGGLIEASNGKIYGTAAIGGSINEGSIFEFDPVNGSIELKFSFTQSVGVIPDAALMQASNGLLYGITRYGGGGVGLGMVYTYDPEEDAFNTVQGLNDGFPLDNVLVEVMEPVVTSLDEATEATRLFPNPTHRYLKVESGLGKSPVSIETVSISGTKALAINLENDTADFGPLAPGLYTLKLIWSDGAIELIKIIKL